MTNTSLIRRYVLFFFVTSVGSNLSSVAIFLNIEPSFKSTPLLGVALALKTLVLALLAGPAVIAIRRFGLFQSLVVSQAIGILFLAITAVGFSQQSFLLVLIGTILSAIPSVFLGIITSVNLKLLSDDNETFRKNQGVIGTAGSTGFLLAALTVPLMNASQNISWILMIDAMTYGAGVILLVVMGTEFKAHLNLTRSNTTSLTPNLSNFQKARTFISKPAARVFIIAASSVLIFKGLTPILSGSNEFGTYSFRHLDLKQFLWSLEAGAGIIAGLLYFSIKSRAENLRLFFLLNGVACIPMMLTPSIITFAISILALSILMGFGYQFFRDSLMIAQKSEADLDRAAGTASFVFGMILTVSPLLIAAGTRAVHLNAVIGALFALQCVLAGTYLGWKKNSLERELDLDS